MRLTSYRWLTPVIAVFFVLLNVVPGGAAAIPDQAYEPSAPNIIPTIYNNYRWAQTFTVGVTGTLTRVDVLVAQMFFIHAEPLDITIYDTVGGAPHAALTAPFRIAPEAVPLVQHVTYFNDYKWLSAEFTLPVTAGDVLAIMVSTGYSEYYWAGVYQGGYPRGQLFATSGGPWSVSGTQDQAFRTFVTSSRVPTANAGTNQIVRSGTTVTLDGGGSYDDNTETNLLQYAWRFVSVPTGSTVTTLTGATTMTPSFVPDLPGNYVVELVVTDEDGLSSPPSRVTIGENLPPAADAGPDQLVMPNWTVLLNGMAHDPDGDAVTYRWQFTTVPAGSAVQFSSSSLAQTSFVADVPGVYVATLTPSDSVGPGISASATITVATPTSYAEIQSQTASALVQDLGAGDVTNSGNQNALTQLLSSVVTALQNGDVTAARQRLETALSRTDGCALQGAPDGNGPGRDWITTCAAQQPVYIALHAALAAITQ
jgi:K319L-like, PKD domain